jgi:serine protease inhibitor
MTGVFPTRRAVLMALSALLLPRGADAAVDVSGEVAKNLNRLGEHLLGQVAARSGGGMVSALSLMDAIAPLAAAAKGEAAKAMGRVLIAPGAEGAWQLGERLNEDAGLLRRATALWLPRGQTPLPEFTRAIARRDLHVEALDLAAPSAVARINAWVAENTANLIPSLFDRLPRDPGLVITAALHFAARWAQGFDVAQSRRATFTRGDGRRLQATFLRDTRRVAYARSSRWQAVRLPYAGDAFELVLLMPAPQRPLPQAMDALRQRQAIAALTALKFAPEEVDLTIPRLSLSHSADLLPALRRGALAPALASNADYRSITGAPVRIASLRQRVVLKLDETGTQAAAATGVLGDRSLSRPPSFSADRPFLAMIVHKATGLHVVTALVNEPGEP